MIWNIPNVLSLSRLAVFLPALWACALAGEPIWLGSLLILALATDAADGWLARTLNQVTALGARLDSIADNTLLASALVWLVMLRPEVMAGRAGFMLALATVLWATAITIGWMRFRRFANLHLYSHKTAGVVGSLFLVTSFLYGFQPLLFYAATGLSALASIEAIILLLTRASVDEHMGSVFRHTRPGAGAHAMARPSGGPR